MRLPLSWIQDFVEVKESPEKLAELLTLSGSEVEKIHHSLKLEKVVVGEIVAIEKHPNADRLRVATVRVKDVGRAEAKLLWASGSRSLASSDVLRIVCGAPNIKVGQRVPVALPGAILVGGIKLERKEVRGVVSDGMICAEDELGIGSEHAGILVLPSDAPLGASVPSVLGFDDTVFDLDITPNRGDCLSVRGLAREVAALTGRKIKGVKARSLGLARDDRVGKDQDDGRGYRLSVRVEDKKACPLYFARLIEGVEIGSSPLAMQQRLAAVGLRPINTAVDIANYVMMELGQPLHAFDAERLANTTKEVLDKLEQYPSSEVRPRSDESRSTFSDGQARSISLVIRRAEQGEELQALDSKTYTFEDADIIISSPSSVALRHGSGDKPEVQYKPVAIAGVIGGEQSGTSAKTTALVLEAAIFDPVSIRRTYKRLGLRTDAAIRFEKRVDPLVVEEALDRATALILEHCGGTVQQTVRVGALAKTSRFIVASAERVAATIGVEVSASRQRQLLAALGFSVMIQGTRYKVQAPSWRHDIEGEHDIVKEVGRMLPLDTLKSTHLLAQAGVPRKSSEHVLTRRVRRAFLEYGFDEVLLYSFYGVRSIEQMGLKLGEHLRISNPLNPNQEYLRTSLLPNLLEAAAKNAGLGIEPKIFEIGNIFQRSNVHAVGEQLHVAAVVEATPEGVRELKGAFASCGLTANLRVLSKELAAVWKLRVPMLLVEAAVNPKQTEKAAIRFSPLPAFPPVRRDLSIVVSRSVPYARVVEQLRLLGPVTLAVELLEVFEGKPLAAGTKSLSFHCTYSAPDRTLTSEHVDELERELVRKLSQQVGATVRA